VTFTAAATNVGSTPVYQWQVNGADVGDGSLIYTSNQPLNGDMIRLKLSSNAGCGNGVSTPVEMVVNPTPHVDPGPSIDIAKGQSVELDPGITGNIIRYLWSPGDGLSDVSIPNPVASPLKTTRYELEVTTVDGCKASGGFTVNVYSPLKMPNAFSPNGDGRNDVFYVMGDPAGSRIKDFAVFNRWGQKIFQVHDAAPDDPAFGWDGNYKGAPVPTGTYVYLVTLAFGDGRQEVFKGTVMVIR
jgi:gliding motility-associated-like protein